MRIAVVIVVSLLRSRPRFSDFMQTATSRRLIKISHALTPGVDPAGTGTSERENCARAMVRVLTRSVADVRVLIGRVPGKGGDASVADFVIVLAAVHLRPQGRCPASRTVSFLSSTSKARRWALDHRLMKAAPYFLACASSRSPPRPTPPVWRPAPCASFRARGLVPRGLDGLDAPGGPREERPQVRLGGAPTFDHVAGVRVADGAASGFLISAGPDDPGELRDVAPLHLVVKACVKIKFRTPHGHRSDAVP